MMLRIIQTYLNEQMIRKRGQQARGAMSLTARSGLIQKLASDATSYVVHTAHYVAMLASPKVTPRGG